MRFDDHFLEELKSRLSPSELIGKSVKLRRNGREWVGLSPFGKEKTPSFYVNDQKGFYHDFSSGKHGDIISFVMETERLSFAEAVEKLAMMAGMSLPAVTPQAKAEEKKRQTLNDFMDLAQRWFAARLMDRTPGAQAARDYLKRRGLTGEDIAHFGLGYAPKERTALKDALASQGASAKELIECGLLIEPEGGGQSYDRFRDRIIFPIEDARSRVVSFGGRALNPDEKAKYLNGPETSLFHKGNLLYGLPKALKLIGAAQTGEALVVVEGYMDVIACQRAHVAAVAPLGTALTEEQIEILWKRHSEPTLCFDGDKAGQRAAFRALDRALPKLKPGRSFKVALLPGGQDPDDILREKGALALREALSVTRPFVEVLFEREATAEKLDTPEKKAGFKKRLRALAATIEDKDLADSYRQDLLERAQRLIAPAYAPDARQNNWQPQGQFQAGQQRFNGARGGGRNSRVPPPNPGSTPEAMRARIDLQTALDPIASALAQGVIEHPQWIDDHLEALESHGFGDPALQPLAAALVRLSFSAPEGLGGLDTDALNRHMHNQGLSALLGGIHKAAIKSGAPFLAPDISPLDAHSRWHKTFDAMMRLTSLGREFQSGTGELFLRLGSEGFNRLKAERDGLKRFIETGAVWSDDQAEQDARAQ